MIPAEPTRWPRPCQVRWPVNPERSADRPLGVIRWLAMKPVPVGLFLTALGRSHVVLFTLTQTFEVDLIVVTEPHHEGIGCRAVQFHLPTFL